jgi:hypothetical protein
MALAVAAISHFNFRVGGFVSTFEQTYAAEWSIVMAPAAQSEINV